MTKKHLDIKGVILIVAAWVSGIIGFTFEKTSPILFWVGLAGYCVLTYFGAAAFIEAHWQKQKKQIDLRKEMWK